MNTEPKKDPSARLRNVLGSQSTIDRLPKRRIDPLSSFPNQDEVKKEAPLERKERPPAAPKTDTQGNTGSQGTERKEPPPAWPKTAPVSRRAKRNFGPAFWTISSILSLTINLVLIIVLMVLLVNTPTINVDSVMKIGNGLLGGLYTNFEKMDRAHITRTIPVETTIPVKFELPINQQTNVILSQDVRIDNARVTVNTGGLNITNAVTSIVLPQGTNLPIVLNLTVPVDTTVPVKLDVQVDIPLNETQLHEPFQGLSEVVRPYYCMINPVALNLDGKQVCVTK
jgi:hypothetical protein